MGCRAIDMRCVTDGLWAKSVLDSLAKASKALDHKGSHQKEHMATVDIPEVCADLAVRVAELSDLQDGAGGLALGQVVPGVRPVGAPVHEQVVARGPEQQVVRLGLSQGLQQT